MLKILGLLLLMLIGLVLIIVFVKWYSQFCYRLIVLRPSEILDQLLLTGCVPDSWRIRWLERIALKSKGGLLRRLLVRHYARKMPRMISFARANRRVSPDETRAIAKELRDIADGWRKSTLEELTGEE